MARESHLSPGAVSNQIRKRRRRGVFGAPSFLGPLDGGGVDLRRCSNDIGPKGPIRAKYISPRV